MLLSGVLVTAEQEAENPEASFAASVDASFEENGYREYCKRYEDFPYAEQKSEITAEMASVFSGNGVIKGEDGVSLTQKGDAVTYKFTAAQDGLLSCCQVIYLFLFRLPSRKQEIFRLKAAKDLFSPQKCCARAYHRHTGV